MGYVSFVDETRRNKLAPGVKEDAQVTQLLKQNIEASERPWLPRVMIALAVAASLTFAGATEPTTRPVNPRPAINRTAGRMDRWTNKLSAPVKGRDSQPNLSTELLHDLPKVSNDTTRDEATPHPASLVAPSPALRGIYTGAARTLAQSNGRSRVIWLEVTAYCPCAKCCGPNAVGITASGKRVDYNNGAFVAADADLFPFGTKLAVPGYHDAQVVEVIDRGSAIKGAKVDVFFPTHDQAEAWGRQWVPVTIKD